MQSTSRRLEVLEQQVQELLVERARTQAVLRRWQRGTSLFAAIVVALLALTAPPLRPAVAQTAPTLDQRVKVLEDKLLFVSRVGREMYFTAVNVHIRNGGNRTASVNRLGNLILGYNERIGDGSDVRSGSHNLVVGEWHSYSSFAGVVTGMRSAITGPYAAILGGEVNTASGRYATVVGGHLNAATGSYYPTIVGGSDNRASENYAAVFGGSGNIASGQWATVSAGTHNTASNQSASVSGGAFNIASGQVSSVGGGAYNQALNGYSSVSGGIENKASGFISSVSGGYRNTAGGERSSVSGGLQRTAPGIYDWAAGTLVQNQ